ncbi:hypothetical protein [Cohnella nanjingensis]|uniref:Alpha/beta hydrolase n=1 Tax=Cohnella nanjingensis TaxID=1387779 RepID=A0A7X0RWF6_9BACL|nr:hypothetical protein [Cohnella nanjingensis]MBB6674954.1 hypothetical protein [Cohnella nanjingensis]
MQSDMRRDRPVRLYLLAGVKTAPHFMEGLREALAAKLADAGCTVHSELLFPYGDWSRSAVAQLREMRHDLQLRFGRYERSIGGRRALEAMETPAPAGRTILIGHSGGGVAAVHAAQLRLARDGGEPDAAVMIGSPRCRIPEALRGSVLYLYAAGKRLRRDAGAGAPVTEREQEGAGEPVRERVGVEGLKREGAGVPVHERETPGEPVREHEGAREGVRKPADPICRIGSFGGWRAAGAFRVPAWQADKYAPAAVRGVPILGGHADYFRRSAPFVNDAGQSNLEMTLAAVWPWLAERMLNS